MRSLRPLYVYAALLVAGAALRLVALDAPPLDFHPTRQYRSALIARAASEAALAPLSPIERDNAVAMARSQAEIEPPLIEAAAAWLYDAAGAEDLRLPRAISIAGWLLAAAAAGWLALLAGLPGAGAALALSLTLLLPFTVDASRAFMPDPWMAGLTMAALALALRHHLTPSATSQAARVLTAAAAIYVKPMAAFFIAPVFLALDVARLGLVRGALHAGVVCLLAAAPAAWHYAAVIADGGAVTTRRFYPELWSRATSWQGWWTMVLRVIGPAAALTIAAALWVGRGPSRRLLAAALLGYVALGLTFSHHISTHDYYSLPLAPIAACAVAVTAGAVTRRWRLSPALASLGLGAIILGSAWPFAPLGLYGDVARARQTAADYARIGAVTAYSGQVVSLDGAYGYPLAWHARIRVTQLPMSIDRAIDTSVTGGLRDLIRARRAQYFVGTVQPELDADPHARAWLEQRHRLVDRGGPAHAWRYIVYDLTAPARLGGGNAAVPVPAAGAPPIGFVDVPPAGAPVTISTPLSIVEGWAVDDVALLGVEVVARDASGERVIGIVTREGRRPDVEAALPTMPDVARAPWRFMVWPEDRALTGATLIFRAVDAGGAVTILGEREVRKE